MQHEWRRGGMHIGYWWESQKDRNQWRALVNRVMNLRVP
jgi:hypothetical protein